VQQLRAAYKEAFDEWAFSITRLQMLIRSSAGSESVVEAQERAAAAYASYRETRDLLASNLVNRRVIDSPPVKVVPFKTMKSAVPE
jgi:hypothetical protein